MNIIGASHNPRHIKPKTHQTLDISNPRHNKPMIHQTPDKETSDSWNTDKEAKDKMTHDTLKVRHDKTKTHQNLDNTNPREIKYNTL